MSGRVTLSLQDREVSGQRGQQLFVGCRPSLQVHVAPAPPPGRVLHLVPGGHYLIVRVAHGPVPPLVAIHEVIWDHNAGGSTSVWWEPVRGTHIDAPPSLIGGKHETWIDLVGAAGYRIAIGRYRHVPL